MSDFITNAELRIEAERLCDENAELRELATLWIVINKHMSLCATTDCGQCPVRGECEESVYLEGLLGIDPKGLSWRVQERMTETADVQAENMKLRELVRDMMRFYFMPSAIGCKQRETELLERARELGVEKDNGELWAEVDR